MSQTPVDPLSPDADLELRPAPDIPLTGLAAAAVMMALVIACSLALKLGNAVKLLVAAVRCAVQLLLLGLVLYPIFLDNSSYVVLPYLFLMVAFATREAAAKPERGYPLMWLQFLVSIVAGLTVSFLVCSTLVLSPTPWWDAQVMLPVCGMMLGHCVNALSLGIGKLLSTLTDSGAARLQTRIACGAGRWEAALPAVRGALETGLTPALNSMTVMGLAMIPGMMTGQILSGTPPIRAVKYQLVIMYLISSTSSIALLCSATQAVFLTLFDAQGRFLAHRVERRKARPKDAALALLGAVIALGRWLRRRLVAPPPAAEGEGGTRAAATISRPPGRFGAQAEDRVDSAPSLLSLRGGMVAAGAASRGHRPLLCSADLTLREGEVLVLTGPSGCGKTTLLRALALLEPLAGGGAGALRLRGSRAAEVGASAWRAQVTYVRQAGGVGLQGTPASLLAELIALRAQARRRREAAADGDGAAARLASMAEALGLPAAATTREWSKLSGGESQRLYLAALLALRPAILLLDEPTSACDEGAARAVEQLVLDSGAAVVWVTHDGAQAARLLEQPNARALPFEEVGEA